MPGRCPRCNEEMLGLTTWHAVYITADSLIHLCGKCAEKAGEIDEAYRKACIRAKRKWLHNTSIDIATLLPGPP